jgi:TolB protein
VRVIASVALVLFAIACAARDTDSPKIEISDDVEEFAPGIASTQYSDVRLTLSPDGNTALWFSRNRPGGPGGYDIWMSRRTGARWSTAEPVPFNTPSRDFDPAFSRDGRFVYFASDRPGGAGGDDLYRVAVTSKGFSRVESLGPAVNSTRNEWAPMLAPDGMTLLFSSDGHAGAGRMDLFTARRSGRRFGDVRALPGAVNTDADEFDATYLADGRTVILSRSPDLKSSDVRLYCVALIRGTYGVGHLLFEEVNTPGSSTYAPMLDWSDPDRVTFTTRRPADSPRGADLFRVTMRVR